MHRVGDHAKTAINRLTKVLDISIRIGTQVHGASIDPAIQQRLRLVRTDLDRFGTELATMLVDHGERVTFKSLNDEGKWPAQMQEATSPVEAADAERLDNMASRASRRTYWSLPFGLRDWTVVPLLLASTALLFGISYTSIGYFQARAAKEAAFENTKADRERLLITARLARAAIEHGDNERAIALLTDTVQVYQQALEINRPADTAPGTTVAPETAPEQNAPTVVAYPQKVYIQFAGQIARADIAALNQRLRSSGWNVQGPSGERTPASAGQHEIRFSGNNGAAAATLAAAINEARNTPNHVSARRVSRIRPDVLEAWISN
jgi:hypothetical protein